MKSVKRTFSLRSSKSGTKQIAHNEPAHWWERAVVALLLISAVVYARSANSSINDSAGTCSPRTLQALARLYMAQGEYNKAETLLDKTLDAIVFQKDADEQKSSCLINLAWIYKNQGRLVKAEEACQLGLQLQKQLYYSNHPHIAYTLRILASIYQAQGRYSQAGAALAKAMSIIRKCHLADDPVVAAFEVDTARLLTAQGKLSQAETKYEQSLRIISDHYGPDHLYTSGVMADLAKLYYLQSRFDEAHQLLSCALQIQQMVYGTEHHLLVPNWLTAARILRSKGELKQAEQLLAKALAVTEKKLGNSHPMTGEILTVMAEVCFDSEKYAEAETACNKAIRLFERIPGLDSDVSAMAYNCRAKLYIIQGKFDRAYELGCETLTTLETALDSSHPNIAEVNKTISLAQELETVAILAKAEAEIRL